MNDLALQQWRGLKRPLVAILRGVGPNEIATISDALVGAGIEAIEVPLNSPDPFRSIAILVERHGDACLVGAGTVLTVAEVDQLADTGAQLCISPNCDVAVIARAAARGLISLPGVFSPSEALSAARAGATALKFFPASILGPDGIKAMRAVLPPDLDVAAVGGVGEGDFAAYAAAGIRAFGLGSSLYKPGMDTKSVGRRAAATVAAWDRVHA